MIAATLGMLTLMFLQEDPESAAAAGMGMGLMLLWLALVVVIVASMWKVFVKAGQPGWAAIVPIYNLYVMLQIAGLPGWWLILYLIPLVNLITLIVPFKLAAKFGKSGLFGLGLLLLPFIFYPLLAWGDAEYKG